MALTEILSTPLPAAARALRTAAAGRPFPPPHEDAFEGHGATIVPPRPRTRALPFLAQYIAQELIGEGEATPRWREREAAYRAAGDRTGALLTLEA